MFLYDPTSFLGACESGNLEAVKNFLQMNTEQIGQQGETPLMAAMRNGHFNVFKLLIENNSNVNTKNQVKRLIYMYKVTFGVLL